MTEEIIGMEDMMAIYEVSDRFGIDRETISVPLEKEGSGSVRKRPDGGIEITAPATMPTREWLRELYSEFERLGLEPQSDDDETWGE